MVTLTELRKMSLKQIVDLFEKPIMKKDINKKDTFLPHAVTIKDIYYRLKEMQEKILNK